MLFVLPCPLSPLPSMLSPIIFCIHEYAGRDDGMSLSRSCGNDNVRRMPGTE